MDKRVQILFIFKFIYNIAINTIYLNQKLKDYHG